MNRENLYRAQQLSCELDALETKLAHFEHVKMLNITSSSCCLELGDYPEPSVIGRAFFGVRSAICEMLRTQIANVSGELSQLGVKA